MGLSGDGLLQVLFSLSLSLYLSLSTGTKERGGPAPAPARERAPAVLGVSFLLPWFLAIRYTGAKCVGTPRLTWLVTGFQDTQRHQHNKQTE